MDDSKIISLFNERSEKAIKELSDKYGRLCFTLAKNILKNTSDSEECVNDAYYILWKNIPPENPDPLKTYLLKVVRNQALKKYHRSTALKRNSFYDVCLDELEYVLSSDSTPEKELQVKELTAAVNRYLETLSEENRVFFIRRYYFADSVKSISDLTGKSPHFISVRLSRIREDLKEYLKEEELI